MLIARLMLQPADVLILDEPTNDLDIPTLEILEEALLEFRGALVLVTHDRYMLDRVANTVLGLDGRGNAQLFADYVQWEEWRRAGAAAQGQGRAEAAVARGCCGPRSARRRRSFTTWSSVSSMASRRGSRPRTCGWRGSGAGRRSGGCDRCRGADGGAGGMEAAQAEHDAVYERWAELSEKAGSDAVCIGHGKTAAFSTPHRMKPRCSGR